MTTANSSNNATRPTGDRLSALTARPAKVTQTRVLVSEWIKLRSLRCTVWALIAIAAAAVGLAGLLPAFFVGRSVAAIEDLSIFLTTPGVAKAMVGAALGLGGTAAWAVGCGWLIRNAAGAIFALVAVLYVVPSFAVLLPSAAAANVVPFLPINAVAALTQLSPVDGLLPAWTGFAVYVGYAVLTLAAAAPELKRRDA